MQETVPRLLPGKLVRDTIKVFYAATERLTRSKERVLLYLVGYSAVVLHSNWIVTRILLRFSLLRNSFHKNNARYERLFIRKSIR